MCSPSNTDWRVSCIPPPPTPLRPSPCAPPLPPSSPLLFSSQSYRGSWHLKLPWARAAKEMRVMRDGLSNCVQRMRRRDANGSHKFAGISMCVCMCLYKCVCLYMSAYICVCAKDEASRRKWMHHVTRYIYVCVYVLIWMCVCMYMSAYICVC